MIKLNKGLAWMVFKRVILEFFLPISVASIWTYHISDPTKDRIGDTTTHFVAAFFAVSWVSGQLFRVIKIVQNDQKTNKLLDNLTELARTVDQKTKELMDAATGGESLLILQPLIQADKFLWGLRHHGSYPIRSIACRIHEIQTIDIETMSFKLPHSIEGLGFKKDQFGPHSLEYLDPQVFFPTDQESLIYYVSTSASNGMFHQLIVFKKTSDGWTMAGSLFHRVSETKLIHMVKYHSNGFPIEKWPNFPVFKIPDVDLDPT